jgi:UrcA family protein
MNAFTATRNCIFGALAATALALPAAADNAYKGKAYDEIVVTTSSDGVPTASVSYADLDLGNAADRDTLYERIDFAARAVCEPYDQKRAGSRALSLRDAQAFRSCYDSARDGAMSAVHRSEVASASR